MVYQRKHTGFEETRDFPIRKGDIVAGRYEIYHFLGSAAFSRAVQCLDRKTNEMVSVPSSRDSYRLLLATFCVSLLAVTLVTSVLTRCAGMHEDYQEHQRFFRPVLGRNQITEIHKN
jgi:hypothetical protein